MSILLELPQNLLLFSQALRQREVAVTTDSVLAALRGLSFINIQRKTEFYDLLKANFVSRREDMRRFDELFQQFWSLADDATPYARETATVCLEGSEDKEEARPAKSYEEEGFRLKDWTEGGKEKTRVDQKDTPAYSPTEIIRKKDFSSLQSEELEQVKDYVITLSRTMALVLSRRWKKGTRAGQLDFRRTIRQSVRYGGEIIELRWKQPKPRPLRIVLLCDVSGSMDIYGQFLLLFMYGVQNFYPHCETFAFSTRLTRITDILKKEKTFYGVLQFLSQKLLDWSGGTNIGGALHQLRRRYPGLLHPNRTLFLIFSDGWERGDTTLLDSEMRTAKQLTRKVIWLNPHLGSPHYQPLCKGMAVALPHVDYFLPCHNLASLRHLSTLVSNM
jgi:uncharacterized protein